MFEKTVLRSSADGVSISPGQLAEALLYYQCVHLILDTSTIVGLTRSIGCDAFLSLLEREGVTATFVDEVPVTVSKQMGPLTAHDFAFVSHVPQEGHEAPASKRAKKGFSSVDEMLGRAGVSDANRRRLLRKLEELAPARKLSGAYFSSQPMTKLALEDLKDKWYGKEAVRQVLASVLPAHVVPKDFELRVQESDLGFYLFGNLDFAHLERERLRLGIQSLAITEAAVLGALLNARVDQMLSAHYCGDFVSSNLSSKLIRLRFESMFARADKHREARSLFEEIALDECPSLEEVIDSGERSFTEFMQLLDRAGSFRRWVAGTHPDKELATQYLTEVKRQSWVQTKKSKVVRYVVGVVGGLDGVGGTLGGAVISAIDSFVVEAVTSKWRASHFVDKRLNPFLKGNSN